MENVYLYFAKCRHGHQTPIHLATTSVPSGGQRLRETEIEEEYFLCSGCKRIYEVDVDSLERHAYPSGLEPYTSGAPMRRFVVSLPCGEALNCLPIKVIAILKADTTDKELEVEKATWRGRALQCPNGHPQTFPHGWE